MEIRSFNTLEDALAAGFKVDLGNGQYGKSEPATYDEKCYNLAEDFLEDHPHLLTDRRTDELATLIQRTIEDWIAYEHNNYEPPDPPGWEGGFAENH